MTESSAAPAKGLLGSSALLALGLGVSQVLAYALNVVGARVLGPAQYGALSALLSLVVIGNVVSLRCRRSPHAASRSARILGARRRWGWRRASPSR